MVLPVDHVVWKTHRLMQWLSEHDAERCGLEVSAGHTERGKPMADLPNPAGDAAP